MSTYNVFTCMHDEHATEFVSAWEIIMLHIDIDKSHVAIIMLRVSII